MRDLVLARLSQILADNLSHGREGLERDIDGDLPTNTTTQELQGLSDEALLQIFETAIGFSG